MNVIKTIIKEQVNNVITERNKKGVKKFVNHADDNKGSNKLSSEDEKEIQNDLDTDLINVAALARKVYPDHTPEGAQSQLRKHLKNIKNVQSKAIYHIKKDEGEKIRKELSQL